MARAYQGCYSDRGDRALPFLINTPRNTIDACVSEVQAWGLPYAGLQNGGQCWGGRDVRYDKLPEASCNMACGDKPSEVCGGPLINSVYSTGAVLQPLASTQPPETGVTCDLGAMPQGVWQNVTPAEFQVRANMETTFATVGPHRPGVLYGASSNNTGGGNGDGSYTASGLYRSVDCGQSWQPANTPSGVNFAATRTGMMWAFLHGNHSNVQYAVIGYGSGDLMRSTDGGANWISLFPADSPVRKIFDPTAPLFTQGIGLDPADDKHLLVTFHTNCYGPTNRNTHNCLAETEDGGQTWRTFYAPRPETGWIESAAIVVIDRTSWIFLGKGAHYTGDSGATWQQIAPGDFYNTYSGAGYVTNDMVIISGDGSMRISRATANARLGAPGTWTVIANAPNANAITSDGVNLYASSGGDSGGQPFRFAPLNDLTKWQTMPSPSVGRGANTLSYDPQNNVLYASTSVLAPQGIRPGGVWRIKLR